MDIVEFLTARLDEDERRYKRLVYGDTHWKMLRTSAHLGSWAYSRQQGLGIGVATNDALMDAGLERMRKTLDGWQRDHAKQWLAEVKAKRAVVALHEITTHPEYWGYLRWPPEATNAAERDRVYGKPTGETVYSCAVCDGFDNMDELVMRAESGCETLRYLAAAYDQHPDYDPAWSVNLT